MKTNGQRNNIVVTSEFIFWATNIWLNIFRCLSTLCNLRLTPASSGKLERLLKKRLWVNKGLLVLFQVRPAHPRAGRYGGQLCAWQVEQILSEQYCCCHSLKFEFVSEPFLLWKMLETKKTGKAWEFILNRIHPPSSFELLNFTSDNLGWQWWVVKNQVAQCVETEVERCVIVHVVRRM